MKKTNYWQTRLADNIYDKNTKLLEKRMIKEYKRSSKRVKQEIVDLLIKLLEQGELTTTELHMFGRLDDVMKKINQEIRRLGETEEDLFNTILKQAYKEAFDGINRSLDSSISFSIQNEYIMQQAIKGNFKGATYSQRIWNNKNKLSSLVEKTIIDNVAAGRGKDELVKNLMTRFNVAYSDADRLARTETMRVINYGQRDSYKANGYTQLQILIGHDERTCDICSKHDGEIISIDSPDIPVFHPNCRCTVLPVIESKINYAQS